MITVSVTNEKMRKVITSVVVVLVVITFPIWIIPFVFFGLFKHMYWECYETLFDQLPPE